MKLKAQLLGKLPFQQLLAVLSPRSAELLPESLREILYTDMIEYCPETFPIDTSGKKREYEGIAVLPIPSPELVKSLYSKAVYYINERDKKRNIFGKSFLYCKTEPFNIKSNYGSFTSSYKGSIVQF